MLPFHVAQKPCIPMIVINMHKTNTSLNNQKFDVIYISHFSHALEACTIIYSDHELTFVIQINPTISSKSETILQRCQ